jgi:hypothetical protein
VASYQEFLERKLQFGEDHGFDPVWTSPALIDFQASLTEWAVRKGRASIMADCGLGKTLMQEVWAENVVRKTNGRVLILTPLAVSAQTVREGKKFGIECHQSRDGKFPAKARIVVTNYERLSRFDPKRFSGVVCDESSILKNFDGVRKAEVTEFMRTRPYRLLCTATAAPNDHVELGTSSEALGEMGYMDMLGRFFKNDQNSNHPNRLWAGEGKWRFRGHAERDFWRWVCSWGRALRKPSDLGFDDGPFRLPPLETVEHVVKVSRSAKPGTFMSLPASNRREELAERRETLRERCEMAASLIAGTGRPAVAWCHLNPEGDLLERLIPGAVQVSGTDSEEAKEEAFLAFVSGEIRVLVTKPSIAGFGLNWQHCAHQTFFPSHSFEQYYQAIRRSWRFGQTEPVRVDLISSAGETGVLKNLRRKARQADAMFARLVELMGNELKVKKSNPFERKEEVPPWL